MQYFADTPDGAWAEFVRHEEIVDRVDLLGVRRAMWAIDLPHEPDAFSEPALPVDVLLGGLDSYDQCQAEAQRLKDGGSIGLRAPSAALVSGAAAGYRVKLGFQLGPRRNGFVFVLFGAQPAAVGWQVVDEGRPPASLLRSVRSLT